MRLFQFHDLKDLADVRRWPCVSICLPTWRTGKETRENPIRLKNAISTARERLSAAGYPKEQTSELLTPASDLVTSRDFWLHPGDGLAVFLAPDVFQYYQMPLRVQDAVVVADHFSLKQLLPLFAEDGRFYVLALSQKRIRFFDATHAGIQEIAIPDMPKSIDDLRQFEEAEDYVEGHAIAYAQGGPVDVMFHGHGNIADKATYKADLIQYLQEVSKRLEKYLDADTTPLIVAAVEYEQSFFRQVCSYHNVLDQGVIGNPDELSEEEIYGAAWKIAEPHLAQAKRTSLEHFADLSRTDKTSEDMTEILPAAQGGRVRTLFMQSNARVWGRFDAERLTVETHDEPREGDDDLLDLATILVLQNRGTVYTLSREEMPVGSPQAAIFRY